MSDIAFLLLVFFMVASVFYVKQGIMSSLPKKNSEPRLVLRGNVYRVAVSGDNIRLHHPSVGSRMFTDAEEFREELRQLEIADLPAKFALITSEGETTVQQIVTVLGIVRDRGFLKISLQKPKGRG